MDLCPFCIEIRKRTQHFLDMSSKGLSIISVRVLKDSALSLTSYKGLSIISVRVNPCFKNNINCRTKVATYCTYTVFIYFTNLLS